MLDVDRRVIHRVTHSQHQAGERIEGYVNQREDQDSYPDRTGEPQETERVEGREEDSMKRIMNDVALTTVLGLIPGFTRIVIEDRRECNRYMDNAPDTRRWDGLVKDAWKASDEITYRWMRTKVREIRPLAGGVILFVISTEWEKY